MKDKMILYFMLFYVISHDIYKTKEIFVYLSVCLSVCLFVCLSYLSVYLFVCLSICLSVCLFVCGHCMVTQVDTKDVVTPH